MCFSATASFVASGGLVAIGVATLKVAPRRRRFLALIPLAFAAQQALEGIQWLALHRGTVCGVAGYGFAMFAFMFWPVFIPGVVYILDRAARPWVKWFLGLGIVVALCNLVALALHPLSVTSTSGTIVYDLGVGLSFMLVNTVLYVLAVCGALVTSRIVAFRWFGVLMFAAALVAYLWFRQGFPSVWCYFAALISATVFLYARMPRTKKTP